MSATSEPTPEATRVHLDALPALSGHPLGQSAWQEVTQDQVTQFAELTGDDQWIHVDPDRARSGPFGGTIGHGFMTLALFTRMLYDMVSIEGAELVVNYGVNKVRFPAAVPVGSKIRGGIDVAAVDEVPGGVQVAYRYTVEVDGSAKPGCVAEIVFRYYRQVPGAAPARVASHAEQQ